MSTWLLNGYDIGLPLNIDTGLSTDIGNVRVNGAKTLSQANSSEATYFKVEFLKEFSSDLHETEFRQQMEQFSSGIKFMPYYLETNQFAQEFHECLVNIKSIDMPREGGKVRWMNYQIEFSLLGHKTEFIGYTQYRPVEVKSSWVDWNSWRAVNISYPTGAMFHSDTPSGTITGEFGAMEYRINPSRNAISYQECLGHERMGVVCKQGNVTLYSPHARIGAGFSMSNGYFKIQWNQDGHPEYFRYNGTSWINLHKLPPRFNWAGYTEADPVTKNFNSANAIRSKLQIKAISTEFVEVEQEFQFLDGTLTAIQFFMNRGKNSIQLRTRMKNRTMDWFNAYHYVERTRVTSYTLNGGSAVSISDTTNVNTPLNLSPIFHLTLNAGAGGGFLGYINPDSGIVNGIVKTDLAGGYVEISTRHSWNEAPNVWSEPLMYYQGATDATVKRNEAGFLLKADSQVVHRSYVY